MANPFLGTTGVMHEPQYGPAVTDHYGDDSGGWYASTPWHLAGILCVALAVITAMQMAGFRAMVGIGRS